MRASVAIVLPPKEGFVSESVGAVGLLVRRLAGAGAGGVVLGRPRPGTPFPEAPFLPVEPGWGLSDNARYARGVLRELRKLAPEARLTLVTLDDGHFYSKPALSTAFAKGKCADTLVTTLGPKMAAQNRPSRSGLNVR